MNRVITNALFLGSAVLCALFLAFLLSPSPRRSGHALRATQDFELKDGESISLSTFSITAAGGFHGYKRGTGQTGDILVFVRDGSPDSQTARVVVQRTAGTAGVASVFLGPGWSQLDGPPQTWTANGIPFMHFTSEGKGENAGRRLTFVSSTIGKDSVTFLLECPAATWPEAFDGLAALVASVRPIASGR